MSCKPDPNLSEFEAEQAVHRVALALHELIDEVLRPSTMTGLARINAFAWAIDAARNELPTSPAVSTVQGLHEVDQWGEMPEHAVVLTACEIQTLYENSAHAARVYRPRKRQKQSDRDAMVHAWFTARAALFDRLMPSAEDDAPNPIYGEDGALIDSGGGPEVAP